MAAGWIAAHQKAAEESFLVLRRSPREALRFITIIVYAAVVSLCDDVAEDIRAAAERHDAEHREAVMRSGRIARSRHGRTRWTYCYESDLLHPKILCSGMKRELLTEFGIDTTTLEPDQRVLVLHTHGIIDVRGHPSDNILYRDLREAFPGPRRVHIANLHKEGTVAENLSRLASYSTKFKHQYSRAWDNHRTEYLRNCDYEHAWREFVMRNYEAIGCSRLLNANIITQAVLGNCDHRMYGDAPDIVEKIASAEPLQLMFVANVQCQIDHVSFKDQNCNYEHLKQLAHDERNMRANEIIDRYIDPEKITASFLHELEGALERQGPLMSPALMQAMYGDERGDLELDQLRADLRKTEAETDKHQAAAMRDRAEAVRARAIASAGVS